MVGKSAVGKRVPLEKGRGREGKGKGRRRVGEGKGKVGNGKV